MLGPGRCRKRYRGSPPIPRDIELSCTSYAPSPRAFQAFPPPIVLYDDELEVMRLRQPA
ncbi:MAG: hypothetical protein KIH04_02795 [Candidatus Freyarchaeota archaeon]|nr:hypothetical protein [Candidatus Jordarchaeia archaeon]